MPYHRCPDGAIPAKSETFRCAECGAEVLCSGTGHNICPVCAEHYTEHPPAN